MNAFSDISLLIADDHVIIRRGLKFLLEGNFRSTAAVIKAHMSFYKHLPLVFERRNLEQNLIYRNKINKPDLTGVFFGSIVWKYYIERIKKFSDLNF